jgi:hypothetical protein
MMRVHTLVREQELHGTPGEVFELFADARNLEAITPPLLRFEVVTPGDIQMRVGTLIAYRLRLHGVPLSWLTSIQEWDPPHRFVDQQIKGPYALWQHTHELFPSAPPAGECATPCATRSGSGRSASSSTGCSSAATSRRSSTTARGGYRSCWPARRR